MLEERRQNLVEIDNQQESLEELLNDKGPFYNDSENDDENYTENIEVVVRRCSSK